MRKVLILMGDGINSENELARAFEEQGGVTRKLHVNEFLKRPELLREYQLLALPGGFSFGDELRSGKILAEKMKDLITEPFSNFLETGGKVIGICNGFQVLAQLGAFDWGSERSFTLAENDHGTFMDKWTTLTIAKDASQKSSWFQNLEGELFLPVRHREGRIIAKGNLHGVLHYNQDVNGSFEKLAGLVDKSGQIFGLMPHPEVATHDFLYPFKKGAKENVQKIQTLFKNGLK
jgi:phosphoribosylformylglycinamidine synthase subunit PurQ / glutaminase